MNLEGASGLYQLDFCVDKVILINEGNYKRHSVCVQAFFWGLPVINIYQTQPRHEYDDNAEPNVFKNFAMGSTGYFHSEAVELIRSIQRHPIVMTVFQSMEGADNLKSVGTCRVKVTEKFSEVISRAASCAKKHGVSGVIKGVYNVIDKDHIQVGTVGVQIRLVCYDSSLLKVPYDLPTGQSNVLDNTGQFKYLLPRKTSQGLVLVPAEEKDNYNNLAQCCPNLKEDNYGQTQKDMSSSQFPSPVDITGLVFDTTLSERSFNVDQSNDSFLCRKKAASHKLKNSHSLQGSEMASYTAEQPPRKHADNVQFQANASGSYIEETSRSDDFTRKMTIVTYTSDGGLSTDNSLRRTVPSFGAKGLTGSSSRTQIAQEQTKNLKPVKIFGKGGSFEGSRHSSIGPVQEPVKGHPNSAEVSTTVFPSNRTPSWAKDIPNGGIASGKDLQRECQSVGWNRPINEVVLSSPSPGLQKADYEYSKASQRVCEKCLKRKQEFTKSVPTSLKSSPKHVSQMSLEPSLDTSASTIPSQNVPSALKAVATQSFLFPVDKAHGKQGSQLQQAKGTASKLPSQHRSSRKISRWGGTVSKPSSHNANSQKVASDPPSKIESFIPQNYAQQDNIVRTQSSQYPLPEETSKTPVSIYQNPCVCDAVSEKERSPYHPSDQKDSNRPSVRRQSRVRVEAVENQQSERLRVEGTTSLQHESPRHIRNEERCVPVQNFLQYPNPNKDASKRSPELLSSEVYSRENREDIRQTHFSRYGYFHEDVTPHRYQVNNAVDCLLQNRYAQDHTSKHISQCQQTSCEIWEDDGNEEAQPSENPTQNHLLGGKNPQNKLSQCSLPERISPESMFGHSVPEERALSLPQQYATTRTDAEIHTYYNQVEQNTAEDPSQCQSRSPNFAKSESSKEPSHSFNNNYDNSPYVQTFEDGQCVPISEVQQESLACHGTVDFSRGPETNLQKSDINPSNSRRINAPESKSYCGVCSEERQPVQYQYPDLQDQEPSKKREYSEYRDFCESEKSGVDFGNDKIADYSSGRLMNVVQSSILTTTEQQTSEGGFQQCQSVGKQFIPENASLGRVPNLAQLPAHNMQSRQDVFVPEEKTKACTGTNQEWNEYFVIPLEQAAVLHVSTGTCCTVDDNVDAQVSDPIVEGAERAMSEQEQNLSPNLSERVKDPCESRRCLEQTHARVSPVTWTSDLKGHCQTFQCDSMHSMSQNTNPRDRQGLVPQQSSVHAERKKRSGSPKSFCSSTPGSIAKQANPVHRSNPLSQNGSVKKALTGSDNADKKFGFYFTQACSRVAKTAYYIRLSKTRGGVQTTGHPHYSGHHHYQDADPLRCGAWVTKTFPIATGTDGCICIKKETKNIYAVVSRVQDGLRHLSQLIKLPLEVPFVNNFFYGNKGIIFVIITVAIYIVNVNTINVAKR